MTDGSKPVSEREQTDESLRIERERADDVLEDRALIDAAADDVINRARARADALLASARAKNDRAASRTSHGDAPDSLTRARAVEDHLLEHERATADEVLREERAEHVALLSHEREETDRDLFVERARSDDALVRRDVFMGIVSHDLRNMLNAIVGTAQTIERFVSQDNHVGEVVTHARRIQRSGARMHRLVGDLVDVASVEAGMLTVTRELGDPTQVVNEAVESLHPQAAGSGVSVVAEIAPALPLVAFDSARLLQVLCNLLSNAIKFTPAGGRVVVHVEARGNEVLFCVRDTGSGIPEEKLDVIFDRFVQLDKNDRRGVGLGLFISKCIVQGHAGRIWAESTIEKGSTFSFALPVVASVAV